MEVLELLLVPRLTVNKFNSLNGAFLLVRLKELHMLTTKMWKQIKNTVLFTVTPKTMKYLGINLTSHVWNLYAENCKTLMKEIKEDLNN